jgi:hypothetical protein
LLSLNTIVYRENGSESVYWIVFIEKMGITPTGLPGTGLRSKYHPLYKDTKIERNARKKKEKKMPPMGLEPMFRP